MNFRQRRRTDDRPDAATVLRWLAQHFQPPKWGLFPQVRTATGARPEGLRIADVILVQLEDGDEVIFGEIKVDPHDLAEELRQPQKSAPFEQFCTAKVLIVPAPWTDFFPTELTVPKGWALWSVDKSGIHEAVPAKHRRPPQPITGFELALLRSAATVALEAREAAEGRAIVEGPRHYFLEMVDARRARLSCDHTPVVPQFKGAPPEKIGCSHCAADLPPDRLALERRIDEAPLEQLVALRDRIDARLRAGEAEAGEELPEMPADLDVCAVRHVALTARFGRGYPDRYAVPCDGCGVAEGEPCNDQRAAEEAEETSPGLASTRPAPVTGVRIAVGGP